MNSNFMLQNLIENGGSVTGEHKVKKNPRMQSHQLQMHIGTVFNQVCQMLEDSGVEVHLPQEVSKATEKVILLKDIISSLLERLSNGTGRNGGMEEKETDGIACEDCQNYEASLQKLEQEVRQHIRLEQQLKIFQDNQQQKLQQQKKDKRQYDRRIDGLKKQLQQTRQSLTAATERSAKLQSEMEYLRKQLRDTKRSTSITQEGPGTKREMPKQNAFNYEGKQNKIDWVHRNVSVKRDEKERQRKSVQKRGESGEKGWRMSANAKSTKMISIMNDKMVQDKTKEERRKAIQSKFEFRR